MSTTRDFVGYGNTPPKFDWPGGNELALSVVVNLEEGAERNPLDGDAEIEATSESSYPVPPGLREVTVETIYEYGSRVGVWRVFRLLEQYGVRPTIFGCALSLERNPLVAKYVAENGFDVVGHGYRWTSHAGMNIDEERESVEKAIESIARTTGVSISGWHTRSPLLHQSRQVLAEAGFLFDCHSYNDDLPYFDDVAGRPYLVVPYSLDSNDIRFWKGGGMFLAQDFATYCIDAFDFLHGESQRTRRMMSVGLHPRIIGRPGRIAGLERFLQHVTERRGVWVTQRTAIAEFWAASFGPENLWNWPRAAAQ